MIVQFNHNYFFWINIYFFPKWSVHKKAKQLRNNTVLIFCERNAFKTNPTLLDLIILIYSLTRSTLSEKQHGTAASLRWWSIKYSIIVYCCQKVPHIGKFNLLKYLRSPNALNVFSLQKYVTLLSDTRATRRWLNYLIISSNNIILYLRTLRSDVSYLNLFNRDFISITIILSSGPMSISESIFGKWNRETQVNLLRRDFLITISPRKSQVGKPINFNEIK